MRALILILGLALIGGTGCVVMDAANQARSESQMREHEALYQRRLAELTRRADANDAAAMTELALHLMEPHASMDTDPGRVLDVLSRAARQGYAPAQALLGDILANGRFFAPFHKPLPEALQDRERGLELLRQASTQACRYSMMTTNYAFKRVSPTASLSVALTSLGRSSEAAVWSARSLLDCGEARGYNPVLVAKSERLSTPRRIDALAWMLLTPDRKDIAETEAAMPPDLVAAAQREVVDLRRRVAESERAYPAPKHKELP